MNRVWIVMAGEYEQEFVHSVFDSKEKADARVAKDPAYLHLDSDEGEEVK